MKTFAEVMSDCEKLVNKQLKSITKRARPITIKEIDHQNERLILEVDNSRTTRPFAEIQNIWTEMILRPAVHVDSILKGSGSSRSQPETILANLPYIEWLPINNKKHIAYISRVTHEYGTVKQMDLDDAEIFRIAMESDDPYNPSIEDDVNQLFSDSLRLKGGNNYLLYGVPGSGKSYIVKEEFCNDPNRMERVVFHPDFTYSDFVGQILPKVDDDRIMYSFVPGPFSKILKRAYRDPEHLYFFIIEEINRGNAPAIFGDIFQILDRDANGKSEYGISNSDLAQVVFGDDNSKVYIPSNLSIIATMNTSDQNVFTLDTAFQRRWRMRMIKNDFSRVDSSFANHRILDTTVTWMHFNQTMNNIILETNFRMLASEDKRLGVFFINQDDLIDKTSKLPDNASDNEKLEAQLHDSIFPEKVIKYLWDDAFRFTRDEVFNTSVVNSLDSVLNLFKEARGDQRYSIFNDGVNEALRISISKDVEASE